MRINRVIIVNFRNFHDIDVQLHDHCVIVGENKVGKSNFLYALRLVLDPSLPDSARQLRREDFWDGLERPLKKDQSIAISVELTDFEGDENLLSVLGDHLVVPQPMVARLTYVFRPLPTLEADPVKDADYEFFMFGGDRPDNHVGYEVRGRIPLDVLQALRDAEGDLAQWRRSPLKPILDEAVGQIDQDELDGLSQQVNEAMEAVRSHKAIQQLGGRIVGRLVEMVGEGHAVDAALGFSPTDPQRLFRALRLFLDQGARGIGEASLGTANLIYLALKSLELEQLVGEGRRDHSFLGIEEPEAHLHPHLQRLIYRDFLRPRGHEDGEPRLAEDRRKGTTVILTTHSPHIVSVAPLRSLILLRKVVDGSTEAISTARIILTDDDVADLERYIDVTRGEMLFARGVLLVEGDAEVFLLPALARLMEVDLDRLGITVCSVSGTNFTPYVKLLGSAALKIPFAVMTDFDPMEGDRNLGLGRLYRLLKEMLPEEPEQNIKDNLRNYLRNNGLFINTHTFEVDLFQVGHHEVLCRALVDLTTNQAARTRAQSWMATPESLDIVQYLKDIEAIGKGRFAQRVASRLDEGQPPTYIEEAVRHVAARCR